MSRRRVLAVAFGAGALLAAAALTVGRDESAERGSPPVAARAAAISLARPGWEAERVNQSMEASDAVVERLHREGVSDVSEHLNRRLGEIVVTERDGRAFHAANPEVFGRRSYEESRSQVEELLRLHVLREELDLPTPENGLRYP